MRESVGVSPCVYTCVRVVSLHGSDQKHTSYCHPNKNVSHLLHVICKHIVIQSSLNVYMSVYTLHIYQYVHMSSIGYTHISLNVAGLGYFQCYKIIHNTLKNIVE